MIAYLIFFIVTLGLCYCTVIYCPKVANQISKFGLYLTENTFPSTSQYEHNKFAILRVAFGLILIIRSYYIFYFLLPSEQFSAIGIWTLAELFAGILVATGLLTQWALIFLMLGMWHIGDHIIEKSTLGNDVAAMLSLLLLLTNAGKYISLDAVIIKNAPKSRRLLIYYNGVPTLNQIALAKFSALTSYWALCVYSVVAHINDPAWVNGVAGPLLLTNNFMTKGYSLFATVFSASEGATYLARFLLWLMILWYPLILPFVMLGGIFRKYIIVWGCLFIAMSSCVFILGYLAEIEIVLWLGMFWSQLGFNKKIRIFFDDHSNVCNKNIQLITLLDIFRTVELRPLSSNQDAFKKYNTPSGQALIDLYSVTENDSDIKSDFNFYIQLSKTVVVLWPLLPFLYLCKLLKIDALIYEFIATKQKKLLGVCEQPSYKFTTPSTTSLSQSPMVSVITLHVALLTVFYFLVLPHGFIVPNPSPFLVAGGNAAHFYGITPIDVFNKTDLGMAENWFVLESLDFKEPVPLFTNEGTRLSMHKSDRIIFGHTVRFRRGVIGTENCQFETWKEKLTYVTKVYLHMKDAVPGTYSFTYQQIYQPLPDWDALLENKYLINPITNKCIVEYTVNYTE